MPSRDREPQVAVYIFAYLLLSAAATATEQEAPEATAAQAAETERYDPGDPPERKEPIRHEQGGWDAGVRGSDRRNVVSIRRFVRYYRGSTGGIRSAALDLIRFDVNWVAPCTLAKCVTVRRVISGAGRGGNRENNQKYTYILEYDTQQMFAAPSLLRRRF